MQTLGHEARGLASVRQTVEEEEVTPLTEGCTCEVHTLIPLTATKHRSHKAEAGPSPRQGSTGHGSSLLLSSKEQVAHCSSVESNRVVAEWVGMALLPKQTCRSSLIFPRRGKTSLVRPDKEDLAPAVGLMA